MIILLDISVVFIMIALVLSKYYDYRTFYYIEHKSGKEKISLSYWKRMPLLIFTEEYKKFLINASKEDIAKMSYYIRGYFFSLAVMIMLILMLLLIKIFLNPSI